MKQLTALSLSIGFLALVATWFFLSVGGILIWAAFLAWASFYHSGADEGALRNTVVCNIFGCFMAWIAAIAILAIPLGSATRITAVGRTRRRRNGLHRVLCRKHQSFRGNPGNVLRYAGTFAFLLQTPGKLSLANLLSPSLNNGPIVVGLSLVIGAGFGYASAKLGAALTARAKASVA